MVKAVLKLVLDQPGGSYWNVGGRRWTSDESREAKFATGQKAATPSADAPAAVFVDEEIPALCCDECGKELAGADMVWVVGGEADYCEACSLGMGSTTGGGGEWKKAKDRLNEEMAEGEGGSAGEASAPEAAESAIREQLGLPPVGEPVGEPFSPLMPAVGSPSVGQEWRRAHS